MTAQVDLLTLRYRRFLPAFSPDGGRILKDIRWRSTSANVRRMFVPTLTRELLTVPVSCGAEHRLAASVVQRESRSTANPNAAGAAKRVNAYKSIKNPGEEDMAKHLRRQSPSVRSSKSSRISGKYEIRVLR